MKRDLAKSFREKPWIKLDKFNGRFYLDVTEFEKSVEFREQLEKLSNFVRRLA